MAKDKSINIESESDTAFRAVEVSITFKDERIETEIVPEMIAEFITDMLLDWKTNFKFTPRDMEEFQRNEMKLRGYNTTIGEGTKLGDEGPSTTSIVHPDNNVPFSYTNDDNKG